MTATSSSINNSDQTQNETQNSDPSAESNSSPQENSRENVELALSPEDILGEQPQTNQSAEIDLLESALNQSSVNVAAKSAGGSLKSVGKRAFDVANRMAQASDIENLYQIAVTEIRKRFQVERAVIYRFHAEAHGDVIAESLSAGYSPMLGESLPAIAFGANSAESYKQQPAVAITDAVETSVTPHQMQLFNQILVKAS